MSVEESSETMRSGWSRGCNDKFHKDRILAYSTRQLNCVNVNSPLGYNMPMFSTSREEFESFVREGVEAIPQKFRPRINNVAFLVYAEPTARQRKQNKLHPQETLFGLYEGIPHPARGENYGGLVMPDKITIFKEPIESEARLLLKEQFSNNIRSYTTADRKEMFGREVRKLVVDTVWHEVAHHFGLSEEKVEERERKR